MGNKVWLGYGFKGGATHFISQYEDIATAGNHKEGMIRVSGVQWFTNLEIKKRHENLILYRNYIPDEYPHYDNFDAIECCPTTNIPMDYDGLMGVPVTFLDKYNPEQFEIVGILNHGCDSEYDLAKPILNGKEKFSRILIRRKPQQDDQPVSYNQPDTTLSLAAEDSESYNQTDRL
jgi:hypothetical protein